MNDINRYIITGVVFGDPVFNGSNPNNPILTFCVQTLEKRGSSKEPLETLHACTQKGRGTEEIQLRHGDPVAIEGKFRSDVFGKYVLVEKIT